MKPELDRVKNDLATIQKAMGFPSFTREWIRWLKRDSWLNLWWCVPGLILIAAAFLPLEAATTWLGLRAAQWIGLLVAGVLLGMLVIWPRVTCSAARPAEVVREYKRINAQCGWFLPAFLIQFAAYFAWGRQHGLGGEAFMAGLWLMCGSSMLLLAVITKSWVFLGWAIPLLAFGLTQPLLHGRGGSLWLGLMFIVAALLSSLIQLWQFRAMEKEHAAD
jgi:hypothetical protein